MQRPASLRRQLLVGILVPVVALLAVAGAMLYQRALAAANTAYDRTLLASAKVIGEQLDVTGYDRDARLHARVPYSALEAFEADNQSQMVYRVSNLQGELVSGYGDLPFWRGHLPEQPALRRPGRLLRRPLRRRGGAGGGAAAAGRQRQGPRHGGGAGRRDARAAPAAWRARSCWTRCGARPWWWR